MVRGEVKSRTTVDRVSRNGKNQAAQVVQPEAELNEGLPTHANCALLCDHYTVLMLVRDVKMYVALTFFLFSASSVCSGSQQPKIVISLQAGTPSEIKRFQVTCNGKNPREESFVDSQIEPETTSSLFVSQCNASFFYEKSFKEIERNITELEIEHIELSSAINDFSLKNLMQLQRLVLVNNGLTEIPSNFFYGFLHLKRLFVARNELESAEFLRHVNLEMLALLDNTVGISTENLRHLENLKELHLNNFDISLLQKNDTFTTMKNLEILNLTQRNNPGMAFTLPANIFKENVKLRELILRSNSIRDVHSNTFETLSQLKTLDLSHNSLFSAKMTRWFRNLAILETLDLSMNGLESLEQEMFLGLSNLNTLILSYNNFDHFQFTEGVLFCYLEKLKTIVMSGCSLKHLTPDWFLNLTRLESIDLSNNEINELHYKDFLHLSSSTGSKHVEVNLEGNAVTRIHVQPRESVQNNNVTTFWDIKLDRGVLAANKCDKEHLSFFAESKIRLGFDGPSANLELYTAEKCECSGNFEPCACEFDPKTKKIVLNCASKLMSNLTILENMITSLNNYVNYTIDMDLSNNSIKSDFAQVLELLNHAPVSSLNLKWNKITGSVGLAEWEEKLPWLKFLDLRNNRVDRVLFYESAQAPDIFLEGNPLRCECHEHFWLKPWISRRNISMKSILTDFEKLFCYLTKNETTLFLHLSNLTVSEHEAHCGKDQWKILVGVLFAPLISATVIAGLLIRKKLRKLNESFDDSRSGNNNEYSSMQYDAFISYSHKDEEFLIKEVVSVLENPGNGQPSYRLCLHERDW